jgi:hypothetical protein
MASLFGFLGMDFDESRREKEKFDVDASNAVNGLTGKMHYPPQHVSVQDERVPKDEGQSRNPKTYSPKHAGKAALTSAFGYMWREGRSNGSFDFQSQWPSDPSF